MDTEEQEATALRWCEGGYRLRTKKGAPFVGYAASFYWNEHMKHFGVVVIASDVGFDGVVHVYPVNQLEPA